MEKLLGDDHGGYWPTFSNEYVSDTEGWDLASATNGKWKLKSKTNGCELNFYQSKSAATASKDDDKTASLKLMADFYGATVDQIAPKTGVALLPYGLMPSEKKNGNVDMIGFASSGQGKDGITAYFATLVRSFPAFGFEIAIDASCATQADIEALTKELPARVSVLAR